MDRSSAEGSPAEQGLPDPEVGRGIALAERAERSLAIGLSDRPADRERAMDGVREAYARAGLTTPERVLWFDSPEAAIDALAGLDAPTRGASVRARIRNHPWGRARAALLAELGGVGFARHWAAAGERPWRQLIDQIVTPLRTRLGAQFAEVPTSEAGRDLLARRGRVLLDAVFGQYEAAWLGAYPPAHPDLVGLSRVAESAGWWWPFERLVVLTERPTTLRRDNLGRLHHGDGPALAYPDGFALHAWRGMPIPPSVVTELSTLTLERIQSEDNAETRRVMLEYFGYDRYLRESKAVRVDSDDYGTLWRVNFRDDEPLVMVEVVNATPEPDGSRRTYFLRVPPDTRTAHQATAWTFGLTAEEYHPVRQT